MLHAWWIGTGLALMAASAMAAEPAGEALGAGLVNPGYEEKPAWFKPSFLDIREDVAEAGAEGRRVMLYFYQDGCPYCAKLLRDNLSQRAIESRMRESFDVIAINMWGDREVTGFSGAAMSEKMFAESLRVMFTPTLLLLNEQGDVVLRVNGYYAPHKFQAALDYVAGHHEARQSFRDFYRDQGVVPSAGVMHAAPGYLQPPYRLPASDRPGDRPLLVMFEQPRCAPCDELHLDILQRPASRELLEKFDVVLLDMWSRTPLVTPAGQQTTASEWARELNVHYAPTLVFLDATGQEVFRTEAYLKTFHIQSAMDYVASGAWREQPAFQRFIAARADKLEAQGIHVDLMD